MFENQSNQISGAFLSGNRLELPVLAHLRQQLLMDELLPPLLDGLPFHAMVLSPQRQILAANRSMLQLLQVTDMDHLLGKRPGDALGCVNAAQGADGCGSDHHCLYCGAARSVADCLQAGHQVDHECRITLGGEAPQSLDLQVYSTPTVIGGVPVIICILKDVSAEKRRNVLERVFFHDVLNTAGGIKGIASLLESGILDPAKQEEYRNWLTELADRLIDEISSQRKLVAAERGEFRPDLGTVAVDRLLRDVVRLYSSHDVADGRRLLLAETADCTVISDGAILQRILGNLVKNALEATDAGGTVTVAAREEGEGIVFAVHNPGVIPAAAQLQLFQRSFSTKAEDGRGIGTYSIKLFGERYLQGRVTFASSEEEGTTFSFAIPKLLTFDPPR